MARRFTILTAAKRGELDEVRIALDEKGEPIDASNKAGQSALDLAVKHGHDHVAHIS